MDVILRDKAMRCLLLGGQLPWMASFKAAAHAQVLNIAGNFLKNTVKGRT